MPTAVWNNRVIAQSDRVETVEGNAYFPAAAAANISDMIAFWRGVEVKP
jgi:uncharacterized protein (DUF427 family)